MHIRPLGDLGQTQWIDADITRPASVARAVQGADIVINLVGILKGDFHKIHVEGAANVAKEAVAAGATGLIHVSAIGADPQSPSAYGRRTGEGEAAVLAACPTATIILPSVIFGQETLVSASRREKDCKNREN